MLNGTTAFSGFSTNDIPKAKAFYANTLGLDVTEEMGALNLRFPNGHTVFIYPKGDDHQPATYTTGRTTAESCARMGRPLPGSRIRPATSCR